MPADTPDEIWRRLVDAVMDTRTDWRRAVTDRTGLPFSRIRVITRLDHYGPMSLKDLARACDMDAPAATVAVNDLEERGYVVRTVADHDRRAKTVAATPAGRAVVREIRAVDDPAPQPIRDLAAEDMRMLAALARALSSGL